MKSRKLSSQSFLIELKYDTQIKQINRVETTKMELFSPLRWWKVFAETLCQNVWNKSELVAQKLNLQQSSPINKFRGGIQKPKQSLISNLIRQFLDEIKNKLI